MFAYIKILDGSMLPGRPVDPGYGVGEGNVDNTLPIPNPEPGKPGHLPSVPVGWPVVPAHPIARPDRDRPVDPGYGVGEGSPDNSLPGGGASTKPLPKPNPPAGQPGHLPSVPVGWPVIPSHPWIPPRWAHPDNSLPGNPNFPDNSLPETPPPSVPPGSTLVLVKTPDGKWHYAVVQGPGPTPTPPIYTPTPPTAQPKS